jgi:hypothetical protein
MADNFPQTPGSGRNVASDQVTYSGDTADVQLVRVVNTTGVEGSRVVTDKPVFQTEDAAHVDGDLGVLMMGVRNHFTGSTTDGDYSAISVGPNGDLNTLGRRDQARIAVSTATGQITIATTAYTAGDQLGPLFTLANAARVTGGGGVITGVRLLDAGDVIGSCDVVFFDSTVSSLAGDNAAFAISDADALKVVGLVQLAGAYDLGNNRIAQAFNLAVPYTLSGGTSLFAVLITRTANAIFAAATDIQLVVTVDRY